MLKNLEILSYSLNVAYLTIKAPLSYWDALDDFETETLEAQGFDSLWYLPLTSSKLQNSNDLDPNALDLTEYDLVESPEDESYDRETLVASTTFESNSETSSVDGSPDSNEIESYPFYRNILNYYLFKYVDYQIFEEIQKKFKNEVWAFLRIPMVTPYHHLSQFRHYLINKIALCFTTSEKTFFIERMCYQGFLPMCYKCSSEYVFLFSLHYIRCILPLDNLHISKVCKKQSKHYTLTIDKDPAAIFQQIEKAHNDNWVYPILQHKLMNIFRKSKLDPLRKVHFHSVELWRGDKLAAGEIGISVGKCYTSLSGFHIYNNSGTIQMCALGKLLKKRGYELWDLGCQLDYKYVLGASGVKASEFVAQFDKLRDYDTVLFETETHISCSELLHGHVNSGIIMKPVDEEEYEKTLRLKPLAIDILRPDPKNPKYEHKTLRCIHHGRVQNFRHTSSN